MPILIQKAFALNNINLFFAAGDFLELVFQRAYLRLKQPSLADDLSIKKPFLGT